MCNLILKDANVIDPSLNLNRKQDIVIKNNKIVSIKEIADYTDADQVINLSGKIITPGLIDFHTHIYWGGTSIGVNPDKIGLENGVTTLVDAGSSGAGNFLGFKEHVIKRSKTQIFLFLNISYPGIFCFSEKLMYGEQQHIELLDIPSAINVALQNPKLIKGIKVRLGLIAGGDQNLIPFHMARKVAEEIGKPLMVHIDEAPPTSEEVLPLLKKGDILTHAFRGGTNKMTNKVFSKLVEAHKRGVVIDIGHGVGSFSFDTARKMIEQGFYPDIISSDLHCISINKLVFNLPTVMSKFLNIGYNLPEIIKACTWTPARVLGEEKEIGCLKPGTVADIAVFELKKGKFFYDDCYGERITGSMKIVPYMTIKNGSIINIFEGNVEENGGK